MGDATCFSAKMSSTNVRLRKNATKVEPEETKINENSTSSTIVPQISEVFDLGGVLTKVSNTVMHGLCNLGCTRRKRYRSHVNYEHEEWVMSASQAYWLIGFVGVAILLPLIKYTLFICYKFMDF